jgi:hypothetical protein
MDDQAGVGLAGRPTHVSTSIVARAYSRQWESENVLAT